MRCAPLLGLVLVTAGCIDTGQAEVSFPLRVAGVAGRDRGETPDGWSIELAQAQLAFGPLYLCPGFTAGALCERARMEWVDSTVVDALDPDPRDAGSLDGVTGFVRSWMFDLGITSLLTEQTARVLPSAESLGGNSVRIEGVATRDGTSIPFSIALAIQQSDDTEIGVSVVRKSTSDTFEHDITESDTGLTVRFDPIGWLTGVDFTTLGADPNSQGARAVRAALVAGTRPVFEFSTAP